jgi:hypothetical protein
MKAKSEGNKEAVFTVLSDKTGIPTEFLEI